MSQVQRTANKCNKCGHEWLLKEGVVYTHCTSSKCRSRKWDKAAILVFLMLCSSLCLSQEPHKFLSPTNIALFSADMLVRSLDAQSTRANLTNSCACYKEVSLPNSIAGSTPRMYAYSLAVPAALFGASYLAHRLKHHRIERMIPMADIAFDSRSVLNNWTTPPISQHNRTGLTGVTK